MTDRPGLSRQLSNVEWDVVERLNAGDSAEAAALALKCSVWTVRTHIRIIAGKLDDELVRDLEPIQAIIVWRRWLDWLEGRTLPKRNPAA